MGWWGWLHKWCGCVWMRVYFCLRFINFKKIDRPNFSGWMKTVGQLCVCVCVCACVVDSIEFLPTFLPSHRVLCLWFWFRELFAFAKWALMFWYIFFSLRWTRTHMHTHIHKFQHILRIWWWANDKHSTQYVALHVISCLIKLLLFNKRLEK